MSRLVRIARRPAAAGGLFALLVAVFNWPLVGAPLSLGSGARVVLLFVAWVLAVAAIAGHSWASQSGSEPPSEGADA